MRTYTYAKKALAGLALAAIALSGAGVAEAQTAGVTRPEFSFLNQGDLAVGSQGEQVSNLQGLLVELGFLTMPAGVAPGYFGNLTRDALARYQRSLGVAATGTFDASTRAAAATNLARAYPNTTGNISLAPNGGTSGSGYWYNGVWYPTNTPNVGGGESAGSTGSTGVGYWYNGVWYPVTSTQGGGYYSTNLGGSTGMQTQSSNLNTTNGTISNTGSASAGSTGSAINTSTNLTPTGYWQNGSWYATVPPAGSGAGNGILGYWQNNVWYSTDGSQTTAYGNPNPTTVNGTTTSNQGTGYWMNGVWYPTNNTSNSGGYWMNGVWYSTNSSNNTSGM